MWFVDARVCRPQARNGDRFFGRRRIAYSVDRRIGSAARSPPKAARPTFAQGYRQGSPSLIARVASAINRLASGSRRPRSVERWAGTTTEAIDDGIEPLSRSRVALGGGNGLGTS
jgi:hypothetical protein